MKKRLLWVTLSFLVLLGVVTLFYYFISTRAIGDGGRGEELVLLNEISHQCVDENKEPLATEQLKELESIIRYGTGISRALAYRKWILVLVGLVAVYTMVLFFYVYFKILEPFDRMKAYAEQIAAGDLSLPLEYERTNFFGAFTWAFDHMREEIRYARKKESFAIEENKTIIATLSHDIKTPIASIRAYSEMLDANLDADFEKRQKYTSSIIRKCDEVTCLVNDLVLHSLSELEKLDITCEEVEIAKVLEQIIRDFGYPGLEVQGEFPEAKILADTKRTAQVLENLMNNARKYAPESKVTVYSEVDREENQYRIHVRDYGPGILPEDMPFVMNRFYRGKNVMDQPGSGLGLYIVKYIMESMKGGLKLVSEEDGLDAEVWFPIKE